MNIESDDNKEILKLDREKILKNDCIDAKIHSIDL